MTAARRVGILGGTFDPVHCGHLDVGEAAQAALDLSRLVIIPSSVPPHRPQPLASGFHRFAMVAIALANRPGWVASDVELRAAPPSYTATTLRYFQERGYAASELFFIVGADAFLEIGTWKDYPDILDRANFAVVSRPGCGAGELPTRLPDLRPRMVPAGQARTQRIDPAIILIDAETADVSSTAIRQRRAEGLSIAGMVPAGVQQHIERHGLYTSMFTGRREYDQASRTAAGRLHGED
jgi:nicotinate-nucleotide adenylyltransferase